jgi:hypothetical protein
MTMSRSQRMVVVVHAAFIATLLWLGARTFAIVVAQVESGYIPPSEAEFATVFVGVPLTLSVLVLVGVAIWVRRGRTLGLAVADLAATTALFSILVAFIFMDESLFIAWTFGSACIILTGLVRPPGAETRDKWARMTLVTAGVLFLLLTLSAVIPSVIRSVY